jgi:hypothetical protein
MTPYKEEKKQDTPASNSSVPVVSLLDFAEELFMQEKEQSAKRKEARSSKTK